MDLFADFIEKLYFCNKNIFYGMKGIEEREEAEIAKFTPVELKEYEDSLKTYRDLKNSLDTAEEKGRVEEKIAIARNLKSMGMSISDISKATGLQEEEIVSI